MLVRPGVFPAPTAHENNTALRGVVAHRFPAAVPAHRSGADAERVRAVRGAGGLVFLRVILGAVFLVIKSAHFPLSGPRGVDPRHMRHATITFCM
ncbi:hypothetical protein GCM10010315_37440 [Streptomyces luteosporeus]|uniref:Uncharacterized protein n=1 Tax=Streptomyces luteosporeus TaxID=173856 RepID=A0ABP6GCR8_9ACTN